MRNSYDLLTSLVLLISAGCGLGPGQGWTRVESEVQVVWDAEERLDDAGQVKTSKSYLLDFSPVEVTVESVAFESVDGDEGASFDPGLPPEGYSLCHNGHCHNANDELIPYETIRLELGGNSSSSIWVTQAVDEAVQVDMGEERIQAKVLVGECDDLGGRCEIGPSDLRSVRMSVRFGELVMRVYHPEKIAPEGIAFTLGSLESISLRTYFSAELGSDSKATLALSIQLEMGPRIWDAIDWKDFMPVDDVIRQEALNAAVLGALKDNARLTVKMNP